MQITDTSCNVSSPYVRNMWSFGLLWGNTAVCWQEDGNYEQSSDVRAQLKFFEQLDQLEKQRKEEQEREILLKAAKVQI